MCLPVAFPAHHPFQNGSTHRDQGPMVCLFDPTENTIKSIVFKVVTKIVGHLNYFLIDPRIMIVQKMPCCEQRCKQSVRTVKTNTSPRLCSLGRIFSQGVYIK